MHIRNDLQITIHLYIGSFLLDPLTVCTDQNLPQSLITGSITGENVMCNHSDAFRNTG